MSISADNNLTIYVLNVGQADTSVIITPKGNLIIIDAVKPQKLVDLLKQIGLKKGGEIEKLIITHPHTDHFSSASRLLYDYEVLSVTLAPFWNEYGAGPGSYREMVNKIEKENCPVDFVSGYARIYPDGALKLVNSNNHVFDKDSLYMELLGPQNSMIGQLERDGKLNTNHLSLMNRITWKKFSMIFAADAQMENWAYFDSEGMLSRKCKILRSAHHGSSNGTQWERLSRLDPACVIISSHPQMGHHLPDLVGSSIFAKYEVKNTSKVVALTKYTGSVKINVKDGKSIDLRCFEEKYDKKIDFSKERKLTWANNPTKWKDLLNQRAEDLFP